MKTPRKPKPARWLHLGISIRADLREKLQAEAARCNRSVSSLVRIILANYLDMPRVDSCATAPNHTTYPLTTGPTPTHE